MDKQRIFDKTVRHLAKQGGKSMRVVRGSLMCAYRGRNGCKCAVGCHIRPSEYSRRMEGQPISGLVSRDLFPRRLMHARYLLEDLQVTHDCSSTGEGLAHTLRMTARKNHVSSKLVGAFKWPERWEAV